MVKKIIGAILLLLSASFAHAQNTSWAKQNRVNPTMLIADSALKIPALSFDYSPYANKDSLGRIWLNTITGKFMMHFPGNVKKPLASEDSVRFRWDSNMVKGYFNSNAILNQNATLQTGNFSLRGTGALNKLTVIHNDSIPFQQYIVLGRDATDTTKQLWGIGLTGVPTAPIQNAGGTLTFRTYNTSGAFLRDALTIDRAGNAAVIRMVVGGQNIISGQTLTVVGSSTFAGAINSFTDIKASGKLTVAGAQYDSTTVTVTGSTYTATVTDLYINVNNATACTVTIPTPTIGPSTGRKLYIKNISATGIVTVQSASGTIDGAASVNIGTPMGSIFLKDDGTNWFIY